MDGLYYIKYNFIENSASSLLFHMNNQYTLADFEMFWVSLFDKVLVKYMTFVDMIGQATGHWASSVVT